jgi:maltose O-acetyltransferase
MKYFIKVIFRLRRWWEHVHVSHYKKQLGKCGKNVNLNYYTTIISPSGLEIGNNCLIAEYTTIFAGLGVSIGDNTMVSAGCCISSINHEITSRNRYASQEGKSAPVKIGNNVWIGMNACILPGVTIGDNSIIGAGSVVIRSIPSNEIWVGNPARRVKNIELNEAR